MAALLGPDHPETRFNLALAWEQEKDFAEALKEIAIAERLAPNDLDIRNTDAVIHAEFGDLAGAEHLWALLLIEAPGYASARSNLAMLRSMDSLSTQATSLLSNVLTIPSNRSLSISGHVDATR